jgi:SNF2 family DNA or RNA helicase
MRGGFVADEMGLGKTIMMIGLCLANFMHSRKTLIVLPPVLIEQWSAQIYRTTGHKCAVYHGENKKKFDAKIRDGAVDAFAGAVIVLCSYDAISIFRDKSGGKGKAKNKNSDNNGNKNRRPKKYIENSLLHRINWGRVIFDEAHHLRNKNTTRYLGAKMLSADVKWLVSGTPVQNRKQDFYALCSLINLPASYYTDPANFNEIGHAFILKRTKKQVGIDLIDTVQTKKIVHWKSDAEKRFSEEIHSLIAFTNVKMREQNEHGVGLGGGVGVGSDSGGITKGLLPLLLKARQSCIYPKMIKMNGNGSKVGGLNSNSNSNSNTTTSKLDSVVDAILQRKDNGNGKLVFCHFREEMVEIARRLQIQKKDEDGVNEGSGKGLSVGILDGKITKSARHKLLSDKKDVLILQIQTGCEGLNLQDNYSEVYFVSPHWNPYVEDQAIARCHRIGQKKPVFVWRFEMNNFGANVIGDGRIVSTKNLEEYVMDVQAGKRNIVSNIIVE